MSTCRTCGAPIIWATVRTSGNRMPLDAEPNPDGNVWLDADGFCMVVGDALLFTPVIRAEPTCHTSHFANCPDADTHRRREGTL